MLDIAIEMFKAIENHADDVRLRWLGRCRFVKQVRCIATRGHPQDYTFRTTTKKKNVSVLFPIHQPLSIAVR